MIHKTAAPSLIFPLLCLAAPLGAVQPLPLCGIEVEVPASLGSGAGLGVTATIQRRGTPVEVPGMKINPCTAAGGGKLRLHITGPAVPQGSVLVTVRRKGGLPPTTNG